MPADQNFYATNGTRAYPLDDAASHVDDAGVRMPSDLLVDCSIRFPSSLGRTLVLSSLTATRTVVTATFAASPDVLTRSQLESPAAAGGFEPVAVVRVDQPATPYRAYPVLGMAGGVAGTVVLGPGIANDYSGRFSTLAQGAILPRCAAPAAPPPIPDVGRAGAAGTLSGVVSLLAGQDLRARVATVEIDSEPRRAILIGLEPSTSRDVYRTYAGDCAGRPESGTCDPPGIDGLNTSYPDEFGNLWIDFVGLSATPLAGSAGGIVLDVPTAVDDLCPGGVATSDPDTGESLEEPESACDVSLDFGPVDPDGFTVVMGLFSSGADGYTAEYGGVPALSVREWIPVPSQLRATMLVRRDPSAPEVTGGIVFGYGFPAGPLPTYTLVLADVTGGYLGIYRCLGYGKALVAGTPLDTLDAAAIVDRKVELTVYLSDAGDDGVYVAAELIGAGVRKRVDGHVASADGKFGVAAYQGVATFLEFGSGDWPHAG